MPGLETHWQQDWSAKLALLKRDVAFIRRTFASGSTVASICEGAFLRGEAGLLNGRQVATAWLFAGDLASRYPAARLKPKVISLEDGAMMTSAAVSSAFDLAIHLIKRYLGAEDAAATENAALLRNQRASQALCVDQHLLEGRLLTCSQNLRQWSEARWTEGYDLEWVAQALQVSSRTLMRRV